MNAKTALAVISENCVMIPPSAEISRMVDDVPHVKWCEFLVKEDRQYVYITITNKNCLIAALIAEITLFQILKHLSVRESSRTCCFYY